MQTGSIGLLFLGFLIIAVSLILMLAVIGSTFPAMFPTRVRYGASAIGDNLSTSIFGGTVGVVITSLIAVTHDKDIPAFYLMGWRPEHGRANALSHRIEQRRLAGCWQYPATFAGVRFPARHGCADKVAVGG